MGYGVIGNTADSGSVVLGSSPGTPANDFRPFGRKFLVFPRVFAQRIRAAHALPRAHRIRAAALPRSALNARSPHPRSTRAQRALTASALNARSPRAHRIRAQRALTASCVGSRQMCVFCHIHLTRTHTKPARGAVKCAEVGVVSVKRARGVVKRAWAQLRIRAPHASQDSVNPAT